MALLDDLFRIVPDHPLVHIESHLGDSGGLKCDAMEELVEKTIVGHT